MLGSFSLLSQQTDIVHSSDLWFFLHGKYDSGKGRFINKADGIRQESNNTTQISLNYTFKNSNQNGSTKG